LKPQNLLMAAKPGRLGGDNGDDSTRWELKIADFGFARFMEPQSVASTLCGSPLYMARPSSHLQLTARHHNTQHGTISRHPVQLLFAKAPEVLLCQPYDAKADLWSVGAILFEMLTGSPPFNVRTHIELVRILVSEQGNTHVLPARLEWWLLVAARNWVATFISGVHAVCVYLHSQVSSKPGGVERLHGPVAGAAQEEQGGAHHVARVLQPSVHRARHRRLDRLQDLDLAGHSYFT
jgi:serine/threonine protein kinase